MKKILLFTFFALLLSPAFSQLNMSLASQLGYNQSLSDIWGWHNPVDEREYAFVGLRTGLSIVDVTDPTDPKIKGFIAGATSTWRDIKTWGNYAFCVTDNDRANDPDLTPNLGLLVVDLSNLPDTITETDFFYWKPTYEREGFTEEVSGCHNIYIDEFGFAYLAGCDGNDGGMIIVDVNDGANPKVAALAPNIYAHDVYTRDDKMYASEINIGRMAIYDVSDKDNIRLLGQQRTPFRFTHNIWLSDDSDVAFTTDERQNAPIGSYDVSDPTDIIELDRFQPLKTLGSDVIPHNVHVWEDWLIISYYTDGAIIVDAKRPNNLIEVGNFDTFIGGDGEFLGVWGVYPFLPSGNILGTDISNGLFVFEPNYVRACYLEGTVVDTFSKTAIFDVDVSIATSELNRGKTNEVGAYATGLVTPGTYDVTYSKDGYQPKTISVELTNGVLVLRDIELFPIGSIIGLAGNVVRKEDGNPVEDATVLFEGQQSRIYNFTSTANGGFESQGIVVGDYDILTTLWGYQTDLREVTFMTGSNASVTIELEEGFQDEFVADKGWTVVGDALTGGWERGEPIGIEFQQGFAAPEEDNPNDIGDQCYVTENIGGRGGTGDVDDGFTTLISPMMDLRSTPSPTLQFDYWFFNAGGNGNPNDSLSISVSNGNTEVILRTITTSQGNWNASGDIVLSDFIQITDMMQVKFTAYDLGQGHIVEAGIDNFRIIAGAVTPTKELDAGNAVQLLATPNPFGSSTLINYQLPENQRTAQLQIVNLLGQQLQVIPLNGQRGSVEVGQGLTNGVYLAKIEIANEISQIIKLIKQ